MKKLETISSRMVGIFWIRSGCKRLGCQFAGHVQGRGEIGSMMDPVGLRSQPKAFEH